MRSPSIDSDFFHLNRKRLAEKLNSGSIAFIYANYQMPRNGDQYYPYRQNSDFFYLTGIEQEKSVLMLAPDAKKNELKEILFILSSNKAMETWEGHKLNPEEASNISGIKNIKYISDFDLVTHPQIIESEYIYFNVPELPKFDPEIKSRDQIHLKCFQDKYPLHKFERLSPLLQELRLIKSAVEIDLIKKSVALTKNAFLQTLKVIKPGIKEYEIEATIGYEFINQGAAGHAYAPIVASGKNACILHYTKNNCICKDNDLVLMDFGAEYANYSADLSRTVPVNGKYSKRQKELYEATLRIFRFARQCIKAGTTINKYHEEVCKMWEQEHIKLGLYRSSDVKKHSGENPLWYKYFMHGTSHFMGLDVHDSGTRDTELKPGMVLTCEPGIYIEEEGIGIRIENDILITDTGNIDLMDDIPIEAEEIEDLMTEYSK
ncbi:MAG: aminopeptidase P N-terminal domain-containing protein [Bacteroidales bacterium]|nr:aminopeptidase P N-terminal domain-containing protein [Bacteroidales bacterium]